jgi:hypothetical protein
MMMPPQVVSCSPARRNRNVIMKWREINGHLQPPHLVDEM